MTKLQFDDGMEFDTTGALRVVRKSDGLYVIGNRMLIPVRDHVDAQQTLKELKSPGQQVTL